MLQSVWLDKLKTMATFVIVYPDGLFRNAFGGGMILPQKSCSGDDWAPLECLMLFPQKHDLVIESFKML